jgi:hypothetical protein
MDAVLGIVMFALGPMLLMGRLLRDIPLARWH